MKRPLSAVLSLASTSLCLAQSVDPSVSSLLETSCVSCHDGNTDTGLNLDTLEHDLSNPEAFRAWESIFDRVHSDQMPPSTEVRPDPQQRRHALTSLKRDLLEASETKQTQFGRVPARRLTKLELGYTLKDLLFIQSDVTSGVPDEVESGSFDTVGSTQRIAGVHMESYLAAADEALDAAIRMGEKPYRTHDNDFTHLEQWHDKPLNLGGSMTRKLKYGKGFALFGDIDYLTQFIYSVDTPGTYRLSTKVAAYQSKTPVTVKLIVKDQTGGAQLVKARDLHPGQPETLVVEIYLNPGDMPYLTFDTEGKEPFSGIAAAGGSKSYKGRGLAVMSQKVEGPLFDQWPPTSTKQFFPDVVPVRSEAMEAIIETLKRFAPRAFRRATTDAELAPFIELARPIVEANRGYADGMRVSLRSMLSSPQFLLFDGEPGQLDAYALANRLSYFLWKSMPDDELFALAEPGKLTEPDVLSDQVERMLNHEKSNRFIRDFLGQWLRLYHINATSPDEKLYPEYDELLADAFPRETELFFAELVNENLSIENLIDSDFTFANRRLAKLYGIPDIEGQHFRRVKLPASSPRGGVLTHAAILKTTANGTSTSPVMRGNFVLTNFLGTPPLPPPPSVGSIEPDTRGKTTIREILDAHRDSDTCAKCHQEIDPPGFALESFDPIGRFRTKYRANKSSSGFAAFFGGANTYQDGPVVDASGVTSDGKSFSNIGEYKQILLANKEQVARNFISQLVVYSTGGEIQFADREEIESILKRQSKNRFPVRNIIHEVVKSKMFLHK